MLNMRSRKIQKHVQVLIQAQNIANISDFMHNTVQKDGPEALASYFDHNRNQDPSSYVHTNNESYLDCTFAYNPNPSDTSEEIKADGVEDAVPQGVVPMGYTRVTIFRTPEDAKYMRDTNYICMGGKFSNLVFNPYNTQYEFINFPKSGKTQQIQMKVPDFVQYSTEKHLNEQSWLFRSMKIDVQLMISYLKVVQCKGIDIDPNDVQYFLDLFGLESCTEEEVLAKVQKIRDEYVPPSVPKDSSELP
ncbi:hypothetical protein EJP02_038 [Escherichia phage EJP2]|nr:hypothetical protein EJP02_038 [Escherichia phage EJP2]